MDFIPFIGAAAKLVEVILSAIQNRNASKEELKKRFEEALRSAEAAAQKFFDALDANDAAADAAVVAKFPDSSR